jgi:hypothetical protein
LIINIILKEKKSAVNKKEIIWEQFECNHTIPCHFKDHEQGTKEKRFVLMDSMNKRSSSNAFAADVSQSRCKWLKHALNTTAYVRVDQSFDLIERPVNLPPRPTSVYLYRGSFAESGTSVICRI